MRSNCLGCLAIPLVAFAAWVGWTMLRVGGAPIMAETEPALARYPCVGEADELLPFSLKSNAVASRTYYSLGGENYIQAAWLIPLHRLALRIRYSKSRINKIYAATASYAPYRGEPTGYDAIGRILYRSNYCALPRQQRRVVEYMTYPMRDLVRNDPALQRDTDWAKQMMTIDEERRRRTDRPEVQ